MIVLNGEPFIPYNLRALYPFAHQIIVVEGAVRSAAHYATTNGHSLDNTLQLLRHFKQNEDPADKVILITRDDFWDEKDEMSQAYAQRATGDYLWQVDADEFYRPQDIEKVMSLLRHNPNISGMSFKMTTFWGSPLYCVDGLYLRQGANVYHRLFKWGAGYTYSSHRPPTVHNPQGVDLRRLKWLSAEETARLGITLYHYSLLFPKQVLAKSDYYSHAEWSAMDEAEKWARDNFLALKNPFRVHNVYQYPSWLERYKGPHPPQVEQMWRDIQDQPQIVLRPTEDVERLLNSRIYQWQRALLKMRVRGLIIYQNNLKTVRRWSRRIKQAIKNRLKVAR